MNIEFSSETGYATDPDPISTINDRWLERNNSLRIVSLSETINTENHLLKLIDQNLILILFKLIYLNDSQIIKHKIANINWCLANFKKRNFSVTKGKTVGHPDPYKHFRSLDLDRVLLFCPALCTDDQQNRGAFYSVLDQQPLECHTMIWKSKKILLTN